MFSSRPVLLKRNGIARFIDLVKAVRPKLHQGRLSPLFLFPAVVLRHTFPKLTLPFGTVLLRSALVKQKMTEETKLKEVLEKADQLYEDQKFEELHELVTAHDPDGQNEEFLWRRARCIYELVRDKNDDEKLKGLNDAYELVQKAIHMNDNCGPAHKWCSILIEARSNLMGIKAKISSVSGIRDHIERAVKLMPEDGTSHHVLGQWHYGIAELPWYQRKLVAAACKSASGASFEKALEHFQDSERVNPNGFSQNLLMIGKTYLKLQQKEKALEFLKRVRDYPLKTATDRESRKEAVKILQSLGVS